MYKFRQLINPHSHSDSSLDGASTITDIVKKNIELGATHVVSTEHGNMNSGMDLYHTCKKLKVKPILGCELYMQSPFASELEERYAKIYTGENRDKQIAKKMANSYVHVTVHFKDEWAWQYFCNLTPIMNKRGVTIWGEHKPICTVEELAGASGHITICSSCLVGAVQKWLLPDKETGEVRPDLAEKTYNMLKDIAGDENFFIEVFPHKVTHNWKSPIKNKKTKIITSPGEFIPIECTPWFTDGDMQRKGNQFVLELAKKNNDLKKVVISLDSHFANASDKLIQDSKLGNGQENWKFYNSYHIYSTDEAALVLKDTLGVSDLDIEGWVDNSYRFASLFDNFKMTTNEDRWVLQALPENWLRMLKQKIDLYGRMNWNDPVMLARLKEEIDVLAYNGKINLMSYFFTVEGISNFCRESKILMNVRGSAGGSLLLYLLGVSATNPLLHGLSFGRFLTVGRIEANTLPDADIDVSDKDKVIEYLDDTYGDGMCKLSIDSMLKLKSSIKDSERSIRGKVSKETEAMCKKLPSSKTGKDEDEIVMGFTDKNGEYHPGLIDTNKALKDWSKKNYEVWQTASIMLGIQRQKSIHACGVVIADKPIQSFCPVITTANGRSTGFSPKWIEMAGLVKYDILGVNTLKDLELTLNSIFKRLGIELDPWKLPDSPRVWAAFAEGRTEGVFQFDTQTIVPFLRLIRPKNLDELSGVTALGRPGTLNAPYGDGRTLAEVYVARCNGEPIQYIHDDLAPIFKETMGIQIYQEQTIDIFKKIVGYSDSQAETVRRGISKKQESVLNSCMADLRRVCLSRGWTNTQIDLLIEQIMASSEYSFNKSHSMSYAYVAYACMYLKETYPLDWWIGLLSNATKNEIVSKFWKHVKDIVLMPDINKSEEGFVIEGDKLRAPLSLIKGVGPAAYEQLVANAPYRDFQHFIDTFFKPRTEGEGRSAIHVGIAYKLIVAEVLDSLFENKTMSLTEKFELFEELKSIAKNEKKALVKEEYKDITELGTYLVKKDLVPVFSDDLRRLMVPARGGSIHRRGYWEMGSYPMVLSGIQIQNFIQKAEDYENAYGYVSCIGYVIDEKLIEYQGGTKTATKLNVDVGGDFFETVLWPKWDVSNTSPSGFKKMPVLLIYNGRGNRVNLETVIPLIEKDKLGLYNVL